MHGRVMPTEATHTMNIRPLQALVVSVVIVFSSCGLVREQASATIGSKGGVVKLASGLEVEVPPGALSDDVVVSVSEVRGPEGEREIELEPRGRELREPARLSVPDDTGGSVEARLESGELREARRDGRGRLELEVHRFEHVRLGRHGDDHDAGELEDHHDGGVDDHGADADGGELETNHRDGGPDDHGAHDAGAAGACVSDDSCPCGSECVTGQCTAVVTCATDADCAGGARCREGRRSGVACGVLACHL